MDRVEVLGILSQHRTGELVVAAAETWADWQAVTTQPELDFPPPGPSNRAGSLGLGLAMKRPDLRVLVLDAERSLLMHLPSLMTIGRTGSVNFLHVVCQTVPQAGVERPGALAVGSFDFGAIALASKYRAVHTFNEGDDLAQHIGDILREPGPVMVVLKVAPGVSRPRRAGLPGSTVFPLGRDPWQGRGRTAEER